MAGGFKTGSGVTVIMEPAPVVYAEVFYSGSGPDRHLRRKAESVAILARQLAPAGSTGRLKSSIHVDQNRTELGYFTFGFKVYTSIYYGGYVHEGTGPSIRFPNSRKVMKFPGLTGEAVFTPVVQHPGTRAQPFLQNALIAMVG